MGQTIWVDVSGRPEGQVLRDNSIMLRLDKNLDSISKKLNVACLSNFFDYSELEEEFADQDEPETEEEWEAMEAAASKPKGSWFDPAPALAAINAIRQHLDAKPAEIAYEFKKSQEHWPKALTEELQHCEEVLQAALSEGKKFRFLIVS